MPPISGAYSTMVFKAVLALLTIGVSVGTGIAVVGSSYDSYHESTGTPLHPLKNPVVVWFSPTLGLEPCPTCLLLQSDDVLPDQHDFQASLDYTATPTVSLKTSYADPSISHPTPTPTPPTTRIAELPPASTSVVAEPSSLLMPITPPSGASTFVISVIWRQNLFFCIIGLVYILSITTSHLKEQPDWSIRWDFACGVSRSVPHMAMEMFLLLQPNVSRKGLQLAIKTKRILEKVTTKLSSGPCNPKRPFRAVYALLEDYFTDEERLIRIADMRIVDTIGKEKAKLYQFAIREIEKSRKIHEDKLNEIYERDVFAAAKIEPSFGPSIENAEAEFWSQLEKVEMTEGTRGDIIGFFRSILHSFSYAIAVGESRSEGSSNTRYLSVIHEQDRLIDQLRLLHQYREQAFAEHEDLVRCLCQFNRFGELEVSKGHENCPPWNMYSVEDHSFIVSPLDGPTALSMKVSVSSAPFHRRPVTILDSDPHWQTFLDSAARKRSEQEARLASHQPDLNKNVKEEHSIQDRSAVDTRNVPQCNDKEHRNETEVGVDTEIEDASEQNCDDVGSSDDHTSPHEGVAENESDNEETVALRQAENDLNWLKGVLVSMKASHETPESPNPTKHFQGINSTTTTEVPGDIAMVRQLQEQEWADCPIEAAIEDCEIQIDMLEVEIACMRTANTTSNNDASNGEA